jgi:glycosyltransferase involved in cell wall biosynthesis
MHVSIVIPTFQRIKKLTRCLEAILQQTYTDFDINVFCDNGDTDTDKYIKENYSTKYDNIKSKVMEGKNLVIGCWNSFLKEALANNTFKEGFIGLCDDTELYPDCLEKAVACHKENFPDTDGVVGISQECPGHPEYTWKPYGQTLMGRKFIERYPDGQVCCVDYKFLYQDEEMHNFASSINKFVHCKEAILKHYHPAFCREEHDSTHEKSRGMNLGIDRMTYTKRKAQGLVWGKSFELINKKG